MKQKVRDHNLGLTGFKCHQAPGVEKCDRCIRSGHDCGPPLLPKNDHHRRDAGSKRRIMQKILSLLQSGVGEEIIMEALNGISPNPPEEHRQELVSDDIIPFDFGEFLADEFTSQTDPTDQMALFNI